MAHRVRLLALLPEHAAGNNGPDRLTRSVRPGYLLRIAVDPSATLIGGSWQETDAGPSWAGIPSAKGIFEQKSIQHAIIRMSRRKGRYEYMRLDHPWTARLVYKHEWLALHPIYCIHFSVFTSRGVHIIEASPKRSAVKPARPGYFIPASTCRW